MRVIGWDTETYRIRPGLAAPKMVCLSFDDGERQDVVLREEGLDLFESWIEDPEVILVAQNAVYDLCVVAAERPRLLKPIFAAVRAGRIRCVLLREKIIAIAKGELKYELDEDTGDWKAAKFDLATIAWRRLGEKVEGKKKGDGDEEPWRLRFCELDDVPVGRWPGGREVGSPYHYALVDSVIDRRLYLSQRDEIVVEFDAQPELVAEEPTLPCEVHELRAALALNLARCWGVRTDPEAVEAFIAAVRAEYDVAAKKALDAGLMRWKKDKGELRLSKIMVKIRERIVEHYARNNLKVARTEPSEKFPDGQISTDRDQLRNTRAKKVMPDEGLVAVAEESRLGKLLTTYGKVLRLGVNQPITPEYNNPLETGRTSCRKPNLQNGPRATGFRPCFVPRPGSVFAFCDFDTLEVRTLAQVCLDLFGYSVLADTTNQGIDTHVFFAATMLGVPYEEALRRYKDQDPIFFGPQAARQGSKITVYGCGGGMGPDALQDYAAGYGMEMTREQAVSYHRGYRSTFPETQDYFRYCSELMDDDDGARMIVHPRSGWVRGRVRYTATCNSFFQELAARGAKDALSRVAEEQYVVDDSPLFGCRTWLFNHDEIGMEIPYRGLRAAQAAERLRVVMIEEMTHWVPDVRIDATVTMGRKWYKGAGAVRVDGVLVPGRPQPRADNPKKVDWVPDIDDHWFKVGCIQKLDRFAPKNREAHA